MNHVYELINSSKQLNYIIDLILIKGFRYVFFYLPNCQDDNMEISSSFNLKMCYFMNL